MVDPSVARWCWKFGEVQGGKEVISLTGNRADLLEKVVPSLVLRRRFVIVLCFTIPADSDMSRATD
jgi:hypothetical protein